MTVYNISCPYLLTACQVTDLKVLGFVSWRLMAADNLLLDDKSLQVTAYRKDHSLSFTFHGFDKYPVTYMHHYVIPACRILYASHIHFLLQVRPRQSQTFCMCVCMCVWVCVCVCLHRFPFTGCHAVTTFTYSMCLPPPPPIMLWLLVHFSVK